MKIAYVTTLSNDSVVGFLTTLYSLTVSVKNFNKDVVVLFWDEISNENKNKISKIYQNIIYKKIHLKDYPQSNFDTRYRQWRYNCTYRFDIFLIKDYDKIIFFDSDIIFQNNVEEVINSKVLFGAVRRGHINQINDCEGFNAGLMVIDKCYLSKDTKIDLLNIYNNKPPLDKNVPSRKWVGNEPIFNTYFLDKEITWLPKYINCCTDEITPDVDIDNVNLHFIGNKKPWQSSKLMEQFDNHVVDSFIKNNGKFLHSIKLKKLRDRFLHFQNECTRIIS